MTSGSNLSEAFVRQFERKNFRDTFVAEMLSSRLAKMIRSLREQRGWSQKQLADELGTTQSAISRIESAQYGKVTVATLLAVAAAFDLPLFIDMPEWKDWFGRTRDNSKQAFVRQSFDVAAITTQDKQPVKKTAVSTEAKDSPMHGRVDLFWTITPATTGAPSGVAGIRFAGCSATDRMPGIQPTTGVVDCLAVRIESAVSRRPRGVEFYHLSEQRVGDA